MNARSKPTSADERELIARIRDGDASAFAQLVEQHADRVAALAHRLLGHSDEVADVVQDVFLCVLQRIGSFRGDSSFRTWLIRIVINQCRTRQRRWLRWQTGLRELFGERRRADASGRRQAASQIGGEVYEDVRAAVDTLPAKYREVIVLRYYEGLSTREMSALLGLSSGAVDVRLTRARCRLRKRLEHHFEKVETYESTPKASSRS